jgi:hypothetical protein
VGGVGWGVHHLDCLEVLGDCVDPLFLLFAAGGDGGEVLGDRFALVLHLFIYITLFLIDIQRGVIRFWAGETGRGCHPSTPAVGSTPLFVDGNPFKMHPDLNR